MAACSEDAVVTTEGDIEVAVSQNETSIILSGDVLLTKQQKTLTLTTIGLKLEDSGKAGAAAGKDLNLPWNKVINAETSGEGNNSNFSIHYIEQQKDKKLRHKTVTLTCKNIEARKWVDVVQNQCQQIEKRPKNLFVLINPIGGNGQGRKMYQGKVAPLFKLAGCRTTVKETEKSKHALEIGETQDFTGFDGVISVGGDGLFQELLQGYFIQLQKAAGVNINDIDENFVKPKIPFCLIPAGSSNGMVRYTSDGVRDEETSTLRVLTGETHPVNILTVHEPGKFIGLAALGVGTGFMTDVMKRTDELRWMKKARYVYAILCGLMKKKREFKLHFQYLQDTDAEAPQGAQGDLEGTDPKSVWTTYESEDKTFNQAFFSSMAMQDMEDCTVINPYKESSTVVLDFGVTFMGFVKFAQAYSGKKIQEPLPNMEVLQNIKGARMKIVRDPDETEENVSSKRAKDRELERYLYLDGEVVKLDGLEVESRLFSGFVPMFGCLPSGLTPTAPKDKE